MARSALVLIVLGVFGVGCHDIEVKNGEVPQAFVPNAAPFVGQYEGSLRDQSANGKVDRLRVPYLTLGFEMQGRRPIVTTSVDLIQPGCGSDIGKLTELHYEVTEKAELLEGDFELNRGSCTEKVIGESVHFVLTRNSTGGVSLQTFILVNYIRGMRRHFTPLSITGYFKKK